MKSAFGVMMTEINHLSLVHQSDAFIQGRTEMDSATKIPRAIDNAQNWTYDVKYKKLMKGRNGLVYRLLDPPMDMDFHGYHL